MNIPQWCPDYKFDDKIDTISNINLKFNSHPSIEIIKNSIAERNKYFSFNHFSLEEIKTEINSLDSNKRTGGTIPIKILKLGIDFIAPKLLELFNNCIKMGVFPNELKCDDIIPIHKKDSTTEKENYRPISLLPTISKIFEKLLNRQLAVFFENKFHKCLGGFRRCFSTQHSILYLINN